MSLKFYLGLLIFILSFVSIILNFLIIPPVFYLAFCANKSSIYVIAFFNIISDLVQLLFTCFILSTSIMADRYLFSDDRLSNFNVLLGGLFINAWFLESIVQIIMAINRYTVICLNKPNVFTFKTTIFIFILAILFTSLTAFCMQYIIPCCLIIADHTATSYFLVKIDGVFPYSNVMILAYDASATIISIICYVSVFRAIRKSNQNVASSVQKGRINQDIRYLFQFLFISIFYIFTWTIFETLNHILIDVRAEWWSLVPVFLICNSSSNAIIFLTINREVQKLIQMFCCRKKEANGVNSNQVAPMAVSDN